MNRKSAFWVALWVVLVVVTGMLAFGTGPGSTGFGPWHDWGRMGGWNNDSRVQGPYGGYGMGPGMMGGFGTGSGMGMPFGMMGRYGAGMYGMGAGMGTGMIGGGYPTVPGQISNLTPEQEQKLSRLLQESMERNSSLAQQLWAAQDKLNLLLMNEKRDWNAIRAASQHLFDIQRQQLDANIDLQQKTDGLLTDRQRKEMARAWRGYGWAGPE